MYTKSWVYSHLSQCVYLGMIIKHCRYAVAVKYLQHKILFPGRFIATNCYSCALHILHFQGHIRVKFVLEKMQNEDVTLSAQIVT